MSRLVKWIVAPVIAVGVISFATVSDANADGYYRGGGRYHNHNRSYYNPYAYAPTHVGVPPYRYSSGYTPYSGGRTGYRTGGYYHDTSHFDYHPTEIYRHGNHLHVVPGHYDYHQTGHWHRPY